ncbi:MAG: cyclase family protein [Steroidobacteraceae bacterium]
MHELHFTSAGRRWIADLHAPVDLAIPLEFDGPQPRFFIDQPASARPLEAGGFTGRVRTGSSCNCAVQTLAPHCHGTHTECVGHVTRDDTTLAEVTPVPPTLALAVSVLPVPLGSRLHDRPTVCEPQDPVITRELLATAAQRWARDPWTALVVRTLPNDPSKRHRAYDGPCPAPYFTPDAMRWIVERGVDSLVVDLPSLDRADDGGGLAAHRAYWGLRPSAQAARLAARGRALVTELAYVPDTAADGLYLLDLQVPAFASDAAPSRPVLYPVQEATP